MKNLARCFVLIAVTALCTNAYAQNWIPYQEYREPVFQTITTIQQYQVPTIPQPIIVYQWTPYAVNQNIILEQRCLFHKTQKLISVPQTYWTLQPVMMYK
jgi:hypothetical protein